jgi:hypothetical protein
MIRGETENKYYFGHLIIFIIFNNIFYTDSNFYINNIFKMTVSINLDRFVKHSEFSNYDATKIIAKSRRPRLIPQLLRLTQRHTVKTLHFKDTNDSPSSQSFSVTNKSLTIYYLLTTTLGL